MINFQNKEGGFTLIELLIAASLTGIILTVTGSGLFALMKANQRSQSEISERLELEQAANFITDEIKMSQQIDSTLPAKSTKPSSFSPASGSSKVQPILILNPAPNSGLTDPIIYYLADPPDRSVWLGPKVIYRWGPTLLQNGNYSDGKGQDITELPIGRAVEYYNEVLIDRISNIPGQFDRVNCDNNYNDPLPMISQRSGFYSCISLDRKSVKFWIDKQPNSSGKSQSINSLVVTRSH